MAQAAALGAHEEVEPEETVLVEVGGFAELSMSDKFTDILGLDLFMCSECRRLRHTLRDSTRFIGGSGEGGR